MFAWPFSLFIFAASRVARLRLAKRVCKLKVRGFCLVIKFTYVEVWRSLTFCTFEGCGLDGLRIETFFHCRRGIGVYMLPSTYFWSMNYKMCSLIWAFCLKWKMWSFVWAFAFYFMRYNIRSFKEGIDLVIYKKHTILYYLIVSIATYIIIVDIINNG